MSADVEFPAAQASIAKENHARQRHADEHQEDRTKWLHGDAYEYIRRAPKRAERKERSELNKGQFQRL